MGGISHLINKIHLGDCLEFMRELPDKCVDLVLTDPPYGIGIDGQKKSVCKNPNYNRKEHIKKDWDAFTPSKEYFDEIIRISNNQIIWGANYFNDRLPCGYKGWLIWDKGQHGLTMSDCEIAFFSSTKPTRVKVLNRGFLAFEDTIHPTQKPLDLFRWCINQSGLEKGIVLDCFSGSGTTALACHDLGLDFICIEKDPDYHAASVKRLEEHQKQGKLF